MAEPGWFAAVQEEAARLLGLSAPLVFPSALVDVFATGIQTLYLDDVQLPGGVYSTPEPEFGVLGADMPGYFSDYEFADYFPGAWPLALDGAGGFYCLDLRRIVEGTDRNDGSAPLVWSHAGNLGWRADEHILIDTDPTHFFTAVVTGRA